MSDLVRLILYYLSDNRSGLRKSLVIKCGSWSVYRVEPQSRGRVDDSSFFDCSNPFFLSIKFHCTFSISYKILPYFVYYYCI